MCILTMAHISARQFICTLAEIHFESLIIVFLRARNRDSKEKQRQIAEKNTKKNISLLNHFIWQQRAVVLDTNGLRQEFVNNPEK